MADSPQRDTPARPVPVDDGSGPHEGGAPSAANWLKRTEAQIHTVVGRLRGKKPQTLPERSKTAFIQLLKAERLPLHADPTVDVPSSGEPWVTKTGANLFGLALSGGGIRSATFDLGLLQGLHRLGVLDVVDYLSTVSGGGYVGGFWSAWLARGGTSTSKDPFETPSKLASTVTRGDDTPEVRHLREFSRFLAPRLGFLEAEMWHAILAVLGGLIPTLSTTIALIALGACTWVWLTTYLAELSTLSGAMLVLALASITFWWWEWKWNRIADPESRSFGLLINAACSALALASIYYAFVWLHALLDERSSGPVPLAVGVFWHLQAGDWVSWLSGMFQATPDASGIHVYLRAFEPAIVWTMVGVALLVLRLFIVSWVSPKWKGESDAERKNEENRPKKQKAEAAEFEKRQRLTKAAGAAIGRTIMRLFSLAVLWTAAGVLWHLGVIIAQGNVTQTVTALSALASGGLFGLIRNWLGTAFKQTGHESWLERARPLVPMVLAYLTIGLLITWVASVLVLYVGAGDVTKALPTDVPFKLFAAGAFAALVLVLIDFLLNPASYSLHAFYRDRIARAYLGATNPDAVDRVAANRNADFRPKDDLLLSNLGTKPFHLICCAANDLDGDQVETLSRGSRSVTLSRLGIAMSGFWKPVPGLTLGTALTASAAAFNSLMGSVSKKLGPGVTFLMTTLNLRLGEWLPHPADEKSIWKFVPDFALIRELFGRTKVGFRPNGTPRSQVLHLSDGAHFDNLGLYELVRRHCRYIIVSDCGADPQVKFDDLGNAVRRIREDFGIEIEMNLTPLMLSTETAERQHAVVGTIHYDHQFDKGIIVYFKPTLAGDEPPDVLQYQGRNAAFPHEGTVDQFYDEAQWESYRRLGLHSALVCFRYVERVSSPTVDGVFTGARQEWYPTPPTLREQVMEMTERFSALEQSLRDDGHYALLAELYPEVHVLSRHGADRAPKSDGPVTWKVETADALTPEQSELRTLTFLIKAMQAMEDVWTDCELDILWKHPLNTGWVNAFARWATAPSFRRWWPVCAPCFSPGFQRFLREQFYRTDPAQLPPAGRVHRHREPFKKMGDGLARNWWTDRMKFGDGLDDRTVYEYRLPCEVLDEGYLSVGFVLVHEDSNTHTAKWTSDDFFVPPSLWGGRLGSGFLRALIGPEGALAAEQFKIAKVHVISRVHERGFAHRDERISFVEFYRSMGFRTDIDVSLDDIKQLVPQHKDLDCWTTLHCDIPT